MGLSVILLLSLPLAAAWWVGLEQVTYEEARAACSPSDLATFSTNQELSDLLWTNQELQIMVSSRNHSAAFFWIGLEKPKDLCVVPDLDQRGFRFVDERADSQLNIWREEPRDTCTNVRCGAVALDSSSWGLVSLSCKTKNHFICGPAESKPRPGSRAKSTPMNTPESTTGTTSESRPETTLEPSPEEPIATREPIQEQTRLRPSFGPHSGLESEETPESGLSSEPELGPTFEPGLISESEPPANHTLDLDPSLHSSPEERLEQDSEQNRTPPPPPAAAPGPDSSLSPDLGPDCEPANPVVPGSRFLYDSEPGQVSVECWSGEVLMLRCIHGLWTRIQPHSDPDPVLDLASDLFSMSGPALNQSEEESEVQSKELVCSDCGLGLRFQDGECDDIDECSLSPAPCSHGCVNTHGSFTCTPAPLSTALVHSLIAVAAVMLAVIAMVTVWCCVRKWRKDQKPDQDLNQNHTEA